VTFPFPPSLSSLTSVYLSVSLSLCVSLSLSLSLSLCVSLSLSLSVGAGEASSGHEDIGSSGKSSSGRSEGGVHVSLASGGGLFDRFLSRSSSISLSTSKSYSSKISITGSIDGVLGNDGDPMTIHRQRRTSLTQSQSQQQSLPLQQLPSQSSPRQFLRTSPPLPEGLSPAPPSLPSTSPTTPMLQMKSLRPKFRRSISDPDTIPHTVIGKSSGAIFNPSRARSFDMSEGGPSLVVAEGEGGLEDGEGGLGGGGGGGGGGGPHGGLGGHSTNTLQSLSGSLRRGSLHPMEFFLSKAGSKASSWVSSNSNEPRHDSSARRDHQRHEASSQAQAKRYDAFADHSGLQPQQQPITTSDSHLLSDADRLEIHFQDSYNSDNIGQFKRVLVLVAMYQAFYCVAGESESLTPTPCRGSD
jgi:hypothetical protein